MTSSPVLDGLRQRMPFAITDYDYRRVSGRRGQPHGALSGGAAPPRRPRHPNPEPEMTPPRVPADEPSGPQAFQWPSDLGTMASPDGRGGSTPARRRPLWAAEGGGGLSTCMSPMSRAAVGGGSVAFILRSSFRQLLFRRRCDSDCAPGRPWGGRSRREPSLLTFPVVPPSPSPWSPLLPPLPPRVLLVCLIVCMFCCQWCKAFPAADKPNAALFVRGTFVWGFFWCF